MRNLTAYGKKICGGDGNTEMPIAPENEDAEDDDYIPGAEIGTSSPVCGNGRQAGIPCGRVSGRGPARGRDPARGMGQARGMARLAEGARLVEGAEEGAGVRPKLGFLSKEVTRPGRAVGTLMLEITFQHFSQPAHQDYTLISPHLN